LNEINVSPNHFLFRISHTIVLDDPFPDPKGLVVPDRSPEPTQAQLDVHMFSNYIYYNLFCQERL